MKNIDFGKILIWAGCASLLLTTACNTNPNFNMEIKLTERRGDAAPVTSGTVQIQFGQREPEPATTLDVQGKAVFKDLSGAMFKDTVKLIYHPSPEKRFRILDRNAFTAAENTQMHFTLDFPPPFTTLEWSLRDKKGYGIDNALVTIDGHMQVKTDGGGYFVVSVQKPAGDLAHFKVEKEGKVLLDSNLVIVPEYQRLTLE